MNTWQLVFMVQMLVVAVRLVLRRTPASLNADACDRFEDQWVGDSFPPSTKSQWLEVPLRTHHLYIENERPSMVLLHGTGSAASLAWASASDKLAVHFSIYAPDLPGFGRTHFDKETFLAATQQEVEDLYADWLAHYIAAVKLERPIVVAHSISAFFAVQFAKKYPANLSKLILVDPAGLLPTMGTMGFYFAWLFKLGFPTKQLRGIGRVGSTVLYTLWDAQKRSSRAYFWLQLNASPTAFGDQVVAKFITAASNGLSGYWNRPALHKLVTAGVPVAFIYGETDNLLPSTQGRVIVEVAMGNNPDLVGIVPGAWHAPFHIQKGDPFVETLLRAVDVACVPQPSARLVESLVKLDPSKYASTWNLKATTRKIEQLYTQLRLVK